MYIKDLLNGSKAVSNKFIGDLSKHIKNYVHPELLNELIMIIKHDNSVNFIFKNTICSSILFFDYEVLIFTNGEGCKNPTDKNVDYDKAEKNLNNVHAKYMTTIAKDSNKYNSELTNYIKIKSDFEYAHNYALKQKEELISLMNPYKEKIKKVDKALDEIGEDILNLRLNTSSSPLKSLKNVNDMSKH